MESGGGRGGNWSSNARDGGGMNGPVQAERAERVPGARDFGVGFDDLFARRKKEADEFYASRIPAELSDDAKLVMRQAFAGMVWSKKFYHYDVGAWLGRDPARPRPPPEGLPGPRPASGHPLPVGC